MALVAPLAAMFSAFIFAPSTPRQKGHTLCVQSVYITGAFIAWSSLGIPPATKPLLIREEEGRRSQRLPSSTPLPPEMDEERREQEEEEKKLQSAPAARQLEYYDSREY